MGKWERGKMIFQSRRSIDIIYNLENQILVYSLFYFVFFEKWGQVLEKNQLRKIAKGIESGCLLGITNEYM